MTPKLEFHSSSSALEKQWASRQRVILSSNHRRLIFLASLLLLPLGFPQHDRLGHVDAFAALPPRTPLSKKWQSASWPSRPLRSTSSASGHTCTSRGQGGESTGL